MYRKELLIAIGGSFFFVGETALKSYQKRKACLFGSSRKDFLCIVLIYAKLFL